MSLNIAGAMAIVPDALAGEPWWRRLGRAIVRKARAVAVEFRVQDADQELAELSDWILMDIGLSRADLRPGRRRSFLDSFIVFGPHTVLGGHSPADWRW